MPEPDYQVLDFSTTEGFPPDVEVRAWPMGIITMHRGEDQATIDTTDMTREEVVRSLYVGLSQLDEPKTGPNRLQRRRAGAMNGHG